MAESNDQAGTRKVGIKCKKTKRSLVIGIWNVCTLTESSGDERIYRKGPVAVVTVN